MARKDRWKTRSPISQGCYKSFLNSFDRLILGTIGMRSSDSRRFFENPGQTSSTRTAEKREFSDASRRIGLVFQLFSIRFTARRSDSFKTISPILFFVLRRNMRRGLRLILFPSPTP